MLLECELYKSLFSILIEANNIFWLIY